MAENVKAIDSIKKELQLHLDISRQLLDYRIKKKRNEIPLAITREHAIILLAIDEKIPIDSIDKEKLNEINEIILKSKQIESLQNSEIKQKFDDSKSIKQKSKQKSRKTVSIDFGDFKLESSNLSKKIIDEAIAMTEFYTYLFIFENSVRQFIIDVMKEKYGKDWWITEVSKRVRRDVEPIIKKEKDKWILRKAHPLYYTTMGQLVTIIESKWDDFKDIFGEVQKLKNLIIPIEEARNPIAHNNYLSKDHRDLLKLNIKSWFEYLNSKV